MPIASAIYSHLTNDSTVTSKISTYDFGSGPKPAVFTAGRPPATDASTTFITIRVIGGDRNGEDRGHRAMEQQLDVQCWGPKVNSSKKIRELATTIWKSLHRADLTVPDWEFVFCFADPPQALADPDGFPGFLIPTRALIREIPSAS